MDISQIRPSLAPKIDALQPGNNPAANSKPAGGPTFSQALEALSQTQAESDVLIQKLAAGEDVDLHQVMIASEETDVNFRVAMAIRDRLVDAYREVMRMNV
jgi:flagellar hook-basal body complex protein FliE